MTVSYFRSTILALSCLLLNMAAPAQTAKATPKSAQTADSKPAPGKGEQLDLAAADLRSINKPPLPPFHPQQPRRIQLENGMVVFLQEDHELPLMNGIAFIRGGSKSEPADKIGLVSIYGGSWRTGGSKSKTGDQLDDELEARAARIETGGGVDTTSISLSCLKADFDFVLDDFNDLLRHSEFRDDKIEIAKNGIKTGIARRNDDLGQIAGRESTRIGYGPQSPYARIPEYSTVAAVTRQDLMDWHSRYVQPNNIILGITGDFDSAAMESKLRKVFADWAKGPAYADPQVPVAAPKPGIYFVEKSDVNQSEIRMVASGTRRDDPDYYAVEVMNQIFGGGFSSRLFKALRTQAGLAYSVGGGVGAGFDHPGLARLSMGTKSSTTAQAIDGLYREIENMRNLPVTEAEMQRGKDAILNSFVFDFDSREKVVQERMTYEIYGYPADFLDRFQKGVEKVTVEDVNRVAQKYLVKDKFAVLVIGKAADFDQPLSARGPVTNIDITVPLPGAPASNPVPAASNAEGKALIAKVIQAAGGAEKLGSIKTMRTKSTMTLKAQGISLDVEETQILPDKMYQHLSTPAGDVSLVISPQDSFMAGAMGNRPIPSSQRDDSLNNLRRTLWYVAQHINDPQYTFAAQGTEKVGDIQASVLEIHGEGQQWRWFVDPQTGHVLRGESQGSGPSGPATRVVDSSEWKAADGITLPYHQEISLNGQPTATMAISSYEINPTVDPKVFEKPAEK
ncbi:MAG TPA: pitrilysin family protein [Candidatus Angelobacter sp.]